MPASRSNKSSPTSNPTSSAPSRCTFDLDQAFAELRDRFIVPAVAGPNRLVPLAALATRELTEGALRAAAHRNRLQAQKGGDGQWRSTRARVDHYLAQRHQRVRSASPTE
jgi:hypothetical protein